MESLEQTSVRMRWLVLHVILLPWQGRTSRKAAKPQRKQEDQSRKHERAKTRKEKEEETILDENLLSTVRVRVFALSCFRDCFLCVLA